MGKEAAVQYLVFETSGQYFALPLLAIAEVLPMVTLVRIPTTPSFVEGFLDWQDGTAPVAVVRLDTLLRLSPPASVPGLHTPILLVRSALPLGLLVERIQGLIAVPPEILPTTEQASFNGCATGLLPLPDGTGTATILSIERLLLTEERERLEGFALLASERRAALETAGVP